MKPLLAILLFFVLTFQSAKSFGQQATDAFFQMDSLPAKGVELNHWKFHEGDDTSWARADLDDRQWLNADLSHPKSYLPAFSKKNIGWFRLKLRMDSSLRSNPVALVIEQLGAADFYVNNSLLLRLGTIHPGGRVETNNPHRKPFIFQGSLSGDTICFAIRYASPPARPAWIMTTGTRPLSVQISPWTTAVNEYKAALLAPRMIIGYSFMSIGLGLLFILLYTFFPKERINILFAAFCFSLGMSPVLYGQLREGDLDLNLFGWVSAASAFIERFTGMVVLCIISMEVLKRITLFQKILIAYILVGDTLISYLVEPEILRLSLGMAARALFTIELARLTWLAFKQRNYLIGIVGFSSTLLNIMFMLAATNITSFQNATLYASYNNYFCFVLLTIYIASKYALKSKNLLVQYDEINQLSKQNLEREKEKQTMLASQNEMLERQVQERTAALTNSLTELKETQSQLIQSEKMASLGELTAGIAHEIQNPLNFVNNFSEINSELIDEMNQSIKEGKMDEVIKVSEDIKQNQEKISHHGKRADSIVKSMLQHSRDSTGQKELTDINALAEEYFRLSYHGLRARDKSFNATMHTELDEQTGSLQVVPQNLGRVLLNLFNNAFYAVSDKEKKLAASPAKPVVDDPANKYFPTVWLSTRRLADKIEIRVKDNGMGIPPKILDNIFQPFFTSKPAGHGTGLGLSLSYQIVTKEHNGQIMVHSKEGEYAEFIIELPLGA